MNKSTSEKNEAGWGTALQGKSRESPPSQDSDVWAKI